MCVMNNFLINGSGDDDMQKPLTRAALNFSRCAFFRISSALSRSHCPRHRPNYKVRLIFVLLLLLLLLLP
jgi:hypothetical protein